MFLLHFLLVLLKSGTYGSFVRNKQWLYLCVQECTLWLSTWNAYVYVILLSLISSHRSSLCCWFNLVFIVGALFIFLLYWISFCIVYPLDTTSILALSSSLAATFICRYNQTKKIIIIGLWHLFCSSSLGLTTYFHNCCWNRCVTSRYATRAQPTKSNKSNGPPASSSSLAGNALSPSCFYWHYALCSNASIAPVLVLSNLMCVNMLVLFDVQPYVEKMYFISNHMSKKVLFAYIKIF